MKWFSLLLAFSAGAVLPLQAGINSQLKNFAGSPLVAAFISFLVGTVVLFMLTLILRIPWPFFSVLGQAPWWAWTGGALGAYLVFLIIVLSESLGAAVMVALIITGQMIISLVLDHYALLGYPRHPLNPARIIGTILLLSGVFLIRYR
jgi:bacterial/archaeal transporter family-2 protein